MCISNTHRVPHVRLSLVALLLLTVGCSGWKFDWETGRYYDERRTTVRPGDGYEPQRSAPQPATTRTASTVKPQQSAPPQQPPPRPAPPAPQPPPRPALSPSPANDQITVVSVPSSAPASTSPPSASNASAVRTSSPAVLSPSASTTPTPASTVSSSPTPDSTTPRSMASSAQPAAPAPAPTAAAFSLPAPASPPPSPPAPRPAEPTAPSDSTDGGYHRLLLVTGSADTAADSRTTQYVLHQATPRQAGQLLATLYRPLGPGGSESRYFLVYPTRWELDAAQKMLPALDVASAETSGAAAADAFAPLVAEYYRVTESSDLPAAPKLADSLAALGDRTELYGPHRWAALMMAGILQGELLGDLAAAQQAYHRAERTAPPDSIESLTAGLARIEGLSFFGRRAEAADEAKRLVVAHQGYSRTAAFAECLRLAGP